MTPEQYLKAAQEAFEMGDYAKARASAGIASALAELVRSGADHRPIYPGDHRPTQFEWCGTCSSNGRRYDEENRPCAQCNILGMRAVRCRYCGEYLERRHHEASDARRWVDALDTLGCPHAPDPLQPAPPPREPDVAGDPEWAAFLYHWDGARQHHDVPVTAAAMLKNGDLLPYIPRTRFGEYPSPEQLETWLDGRSGRDHRGRQLVRANENTPATWQVATTA